MDDSTVHKWNHAPDFFLLQIFNFLKPVDVLRAGSTCRQWNRMCYDELLWKRLLIREHGLDATVQLPPGKKSWYDDYKRLQYKTPFVCSEVIQAHGNEVLHVSFSHNGSMFASSSKDGYIRVWQSSYPVKLKFLHNMIEFGWKCTQFSQFNESDTFLLVSGVNFGIPHALNNSGEIAVFSVENEFKLMCRVPNKPYDVFGTWISDCHIISGDLFWLAHLISTTGMWINRVSKESDPAVRRNLHQLFRFYNMNASSIRSIMVTECLEGCQIEENKSRVVAEYSRFCEDRDVCLDDESKEDQGELSDKILIFTTGSRTYTPHKIGFKKIASSKFPNGYGGGRASGVLYDVPARLPNRPANTFIAEKYDQIDATIDLHGHIVGMNLSPDQRFLYVNSRPWPPGYVIANPLEPPPIAQEIDIHVIDMITLKTVGKPLRSHKAYTPNNECFFIFLDVSEEYVASGAEDKHGYIWDRHYGVCLAKLPHSDVVNSVAFNPEDSGMLVTASDDNLIKVWRSKDFMDRILTKGEAAASVETGTRCSRLISGSVKSRELRC